MFSKSHGYCYSYGSKGIFAILLCEASLGNINEKPHDDFNASNLPAGKHSVLGVGQTAPPKTSYKKLNEKEEILVPVGKPENTGRSNTSFSQNEFLIYDVKQVRLRYVIWMKEKKQGLFGW